MNPFLQRLGQSGKTDQDVFIFYEGRKPWNAKSHNEIARQRNCLVGIHMGIEG